MLKSKSQVDADVGGGQSPTHTLSLSTKVKNGEVEIPGDVNGPLATASPVEIESNPLLLDPVVKVLMSQLTIEDLKMSRGVCKLWNYHSTIELEKLRAQMKPQMLKKADQIKKYVNALDNSPNKIFISHGISTTLKAISAQRRRFFQNYQPKSLKIEIEEGDKKLTLELLKIFQNSSAEYLREFEVFGKKLVNRFFGEEIEWPEDLKFPQLEKLAFGLEIAIKDVDFIKNIIENAPKLKILKLYNQQITSRLCDLLTSSNLIGKLQDLTLFYDFNIDAGMGDLGFAQELINMAHNGLKLSRLAISVNFNCYLDMDDILDHLGKLKEFLTTQSDTLVDLYVDIKNNVDDEGGCEFSMPSLPKLKVLEIVTNKSSYITFTKMDLPSIFPNLREIIIVVKSFFSAMDMDLNLSKIFQGSLDGVKKVRVNHINFCKFKKEIKYVDLETYFPRVVEFELNYEYENIPWKNTLRKLTLRPARAKLGNLKMDPLLHLKGLRRLELINTRKITLDFDKHADFDLESLSKSSVKSLKIRDYLIDGKLLEEIRSRFILDYIPPKTNS